jgi:hypothetical protein
VVATIATMAASLTAFAVPASATGTQHHTSSATTEKSYDRHGGSKGSGNSGGNRGGNKGNGNQGNGNQGNGNQGNGNNGKNGVNCDRYGGNRFGGQGRDDCVCTRVYQRGHHGGRVVCVIRKGHHPSPTTTTTTVAPTTTTTVAPTTTSSTTSTTVAPTTTTSTTSTTMPATTTSTTVPRNCLATLSGTALSRTGWVASTNSAAAGSDVPANALDGNLATRFSTDQQQAPGLYFEVNMGSAQTFNELLMEVPNSSTDYARDFVVQVSNDGATWHHVATCSGTTTPEIVSFPTQTAQYVRVVLTSPNTTYWWSIDEFYLYI